ncbi:MAG: hypothetical protein NVS1B2_26520 [Vulcanimicrobiaceae bacterium]
MVLALTFGHGTHPAAAAGVLDLLRDTVQGTSTAWLNRSLGLAGGLFGIVLGVTFTIAIARYAVRNQTFEGCQHALMDLFLTIIPPVVVIAAAGQILPGLATFANTLGGTITGTPVTGPSEIAELGKNICGDVLRNAFGVFTSGQIVLAATLGPYLLVTALVISLIVQTAFVLIAFEYFFAFAQAYIRLSIKAINLGWLAGSGTKNMAEEFIAEAWAAVMRIVLTVGVVGLIVSFVPNMTAIAAQGDAKAMVLSWFELASSAVFAALLAWKVPELAHHAGRPSVSAVHVANQTLRPVVKAAA